MNRMFRKLMGFGGVLVVAVLAFAFGCPSVMPPADLCEGVTCDTGFECDPDTGDCVESAPQAFLDADAARGGALYDEFWEVANAPEPTTDHPFWATRPDQDSNTRTGAETWRCKECHGWDYKGVDGAYGSGSHRTGIAGIFGTMLSPTAAFDLIKTGHMYGDAGLSDDDVWDLVKFVLQGQIDTDDIITANAFSGSESAGQTNYDTTCAACHGSDGLMPPPGADPAYEDFVGLIASDNPWEFQHKVRFGQPGAPMPPQFDLLTLQQVSDLGAYAQTLPTAPNGGGDTGAGEAFYQDNGCAGCHAADASGGVGPSLVGADSATLFDFMSGAETHTGGTVDGVTQTDADNLAAWLASLQ